MDLSILVPSRNEEFLKETVADLLKNIRADTEIIVGMDGESPFNIVPDDPRVTTINYSKPIGQRAITNRCANLARGKYLMKVDAHCAFDEGFDQKMLDGFKGHDQDCMVPVMRNLWAYDWKCYKCGKRVYQDKVNICPVDGETMKKKMLWIAKSNPQSMAYCFDTVPHFQYHGEQHHKNKANPDNLVETMSLQGSCFMCTKEKYFELNVCDEDFGSWGSQGIEVACKFWLSGSRVLVNKDTYYAHMFRTKAVFGFPYQLSGRQVRDSRRKAHDLFFKNKWEKQVRPLSWLVEKFWPVKGWEDKDLEELKILENHP